MNNYIKLLNNIEKSYGEFMKLAKKINVKDDSIAMKSLKSQAMIKNIELRGLLGKFRDSK